MFFNEFPVLNRTGLFRFFGALGLGKTFPIILLVYSLPHIVFSQSRVEALVLDAQSREPIPFAHVLIGDSQQGAVCDIRGRFRLQADRVGDQYLRISAVGYEEVKLFQSEFSDGKVYLNPSTQTLSGVEVIADENPAHRIIRLARANRRNNDPHRHKNFRYDSYNKFVFTLIDADEESGIRDPYENKESHGTENSELEDENTDELATSESPRDSIPSDSISSPEVENTKKSEEQELRKYIEDKHIFLIETVSEKYFKRPNLQKEVVKANRISGLEQPWITALASDFQPFAFYDNHIRLMDKDFLSPLAPGSLSKYDFRLRKAILEQEDTVFIISYQPAGNTVFDGLKGVLYIHSDGYAIKDVIAEVSGDFLQIHYKIQQQYEQVGEEKHWFPMEARTDLSPKNFDLSSLRLYGFGRSYFKNVQINDPQIRSSFFDDVWVEVPGATDEEQIALIRESRPETLDTKDERTYVYMDSTMNRPGVRRVLKVTEALIKGRIQLNPWLDADLNRFLGLNRYESVRLGLGLRTREEFSRWLELSAYGAYGFRDSAFKYGAATRFNVYAKRDLFFELEYQNDIQEPANQKFLNDQLLFSADAFRIWFLDQADLVQSYQAKLNYKSHPSLTHHIEFGFRDLSTSYDYQFIREGASQDQFRFTELSYTFRYVRGENFLKVGNRKFFRGHQFPVFTLKATRGLPDVLEGQYDYWRFTGKFLQRWNLPRLGQIRMGLYAGWVNEDVPYPVLFNARGASRENFFFLPEFFQTMGLFEFTSSRFVNAFWQHNLGKIGFESRFSSPELVLGHGSGFGWLDHPEWHLNPSFTIQDYANGFHESGIILKNLLRLNYADVAYYNFHFGTYYRYGAYGAEGNWDNFAFLFFFDIGI